MAYDVFTPEWIDAWEPKINASEEYRKAARWWEWPLVLVLRADPAHDIALDRRVYLDLYKGNCREARPADPEDAARADFVLSADVHAWKEIFDGKVGPIAAIVLGKIRLERGSYITLALNTAAAVALVKTATHVETAFPEGV